MKTVSYLGSKAVKITEDMRDSVKSYNHSYQDLLNCDNEISKIRDLVAEKQAEIENLVIKAASDDKKIVKEASKQMKAQEKEVNKLNADLEAKQIERDRIFNSLSGAMLDDVKITSFPNEITSIPNDIVTNVESPAIAKPSRKPIIRFWKAIEPEKKKADEVIATTPIILETTDVREDVTVPKFESEASAEPNFDIKTDEIFEPIGSFEEAPAVLEEEKKEETDDDFGMNLNSFLSHGTSQENEKGQDNMENNSPLNFSEDEIKQIWDSLEDNDSKKEIQKNVADALASNEKVEVTSPETVPEVVVNDLPEISEEDAIKAQVHEEIENELPTVEVAPMVDATEEADIIYENIGLTKDELDISKERDIKNLTLFRDYNDYAFTFGQQRYKKEALTHEEMESLSDLKTFLDEKTFETRRLNQFKKITAEDKRLKKQITKLTKEFEKKVNSVSKEYSKNVKNLTKAMEGAKEQAEADRASRVQTQKLNESLTATINDQTDKINNLTDKNTDLNTTIKNQKERIHNLETEIQEKTAKIADFETKLNTVLGIVKGVK